jgi:hypothetical protein
MLALPPCINKGTDAYLELQSRARTAKVAIVTERQNRACRQCAQIGYDVHETPLRCTHSFFLDDTEDELAILDQDTVVEHRIR